MTALLFKLLCCQILRLITTNTVQQKRGLSVCNIIYNSSVDAKNRFDNF